MIYEVSEKKKETVRVELREIDDNHYEIIVDGETVQVDAAKSGRTIYSVIENGRQYEAMVEERGAHGFDVMVKGQLHHLEAVDERSRLLTQSGGAGASGPQTIEAEMPGKVVSIKVAVGDEVTEGQGVVVLEAMKMENEIASPIDGIVKELPVAEGETVDNGAVLFVVEPASGDY